MILGARIDRAGIAEVDSAPPPPRSFNLLKVARFCRGVRAYGVSPSPLMTDTRVRVRSTLMRTWIWELVTRDGHVAAASDEFADRGACETDALRQGVPVSGLRRTSRARAPALKPGLAIASDRYGIWHWKHVGEDGDVIASSDVGFLTKGECERDAAERTSVEP